MRSMNGAAENRGYPNGGNGGGGGNGSTNGGGNGVGAGMVGTTPELKHHADFLTRLLAATPSYMSEIGNPPPGFFSDWLRRLVSKPSGNSASPAPAIQTSSLTFSGQPETNGAPLDAHIIPTKRRKRSRLNEQPPQHATKEAEMLSGGGSGGGGERGGSSHSSAAAAAAAATAAALNPFAAAAAAAAHPLWFFPPFLPNPYMSSMNMNLPGMSSPGAPSSYLGHATSASDLFRADNLLGNPHSSHPFNPAVPSSMESSAASERDRLINNLRNSASSPSSGKNASSSSSSLGFSHHHLQQQLHHHAASLQSTQHNLHHHAQAQQLAGEHHPSRESSLEKDLSGGANNSTPRKSSSSSGGKVSKVSGADSGKKSSSSFSISRLTSPSPSSNSSGGSGAGPGGNSGSSGISGNPMGGCGRLLQHHLEATSGSPTGIPGLLSGATGGAGGATLSDEKLFHGSNSSSNSAGSGTTSKERDTLKLRAGKVSPTSKLNVVEDAGLCVDLRVSGRIWESSGCSSAPTSIYKPLSAFHEPTDVNLYNSSAGPSPRSSSITASTSALSSTIPSPSPYGHHPTGSSGNHGKTPQHHPHQYESLDYSQAKMRQLRRSPDSHSKLSVRYVLGNIQQIYQRMRPPTANHHLPLGKQPYPFNPSSSGFIDKNNTCKLNSGRNNNHSTGDKSNVNHRSDSADSDDYRLNSSTTAGSGSGVPTSLNGNAGGSSGSSSSSSNGNNSRGNGNLSNISSLIAPRPVIKNEAEASTIVKVENHSPTSTPSPSSPPATNKEKLSPNASPNSCVDLKITPNINNNSISNNNNKHSETLIKKPHSDDDEEDEDDPENHLDETEDDVNILSDDNDNDDND